MLSDQLTNSWLQLTRTAYGCVNYHRTLSSHAEPDLVVEAREEQSKYRSEAGVELSW